MTENNEQISPGVEVRLKHDPGRRGITTQNTHGEGDALRYQVQFQDGKSFVRWFELERVNEEDETIFSLLHKGQFGRLSDLRRNLTHIQLTGKLANLVYSMDTTNTDFYAYQFKPVLSFLESPSNGLLIADEVGLGKTIEAGLIWTELRARFDARRLLVVCPAMLRQKWQIELAKKFSINASIMGPTELLEAIKSPRANDKDATGMICGLQSIRPPKGWDEDDSISTPAAKLARFLEDAASGDSLFDLVIVDESHYMRNPNTQSFKLGRLLRGVSEHIVLLSATPVNLHEDDLFHQLNLVDPSFFTDKGVFPQVLKANAPLLEARELVRNKNSQRAEIIDKLRTALSHPLLSNNQQLRYLIDNSVTSDQLRTNEGRVHLINRIERINLLAHAVSRTRKSEVHELRVVRRPFSHFVPMAGCEREIYDRVSETIFKYAEQKDVNSGFLLASPQRQVSSCIYAAIKSWSESATQNFEEQVYEDFGLDSEDLCEADSQPILELLKKAVVPNASMIELRTNDSKYLKFRELLLEYLQENENEKVVVFSYYPGTLAYLEERLREDDIQSEVLHGSIGETKNEVIERFRDNDPIRVLLSSEVASEGVDLQFCRLLINYDLPWNPMKVEQRIGRIDRLGQTAETISIVNLGHSNTIDERIFSRLLDRLGIFERSLGGMDVILGETINDLTSNVLVRRMTASEQEQQIEQSRLAIERIRQDQERLEKEASHMIAHGGYILEQVHAAHQFKKRITSEDLMVYVKDFVSSHAIGSLFQQTQTDPLTFKIRLSAQCASEFDDFLKQAKLHGQTRLATGDTLSCVFRNKLEPLKSREEVISQFHPLVRFISKYLRDRDEAFYPLISVKLPFCQEAKANHGIFAFAVRRWSFSGLKQDEEIRARAISISDGQELESDYALSLINKARFSGQDWPEAKRTVPPLELEQGIVHCMDRLDIDFASESRERQLENIDRVTFQLDSARRHLERQQQIIMQRIETLRSRNNQRMIPLQEAQVFKLKEKFQTLEAKFNSRLELERNSFDVCYGVLLLEQGG